MWFAKCILTWFDCIFIFLKLWLIWSYWDSFLARAMYGTLFVILSTDRLACMIRQQWPFCKLRWKVVIGLSGFKQTQVYYIDSCNAYRALVLLGTDRWVNSEVFESKSCCLKIRPAQVWLYFLTLLPGGGLWGKWCHIFSLNPSPELCQEV